MMSRGVLAGTRNADHPDTSTPATPASAMVGRSGATDNRLALATASPRSWPCRTSGSLDAARDEIIEGRTRPAIRHMRQFDPGLPLEQFAGEMQRRAMA